MSQWPSIDIIKRCSVRRLFVGILFAFLCSIYITGLVLKWMKEQGGLEFFEERNARKAELLYDTMEKSNGFYE